LKIEPDIVKELRQMDQSKQSVKKENKKLKTSQNKIHEYTTNFEFKIEEKNKKLNENEIILMDFFDNSNDLIQSVGPDGNFFYVNKSWMNTLGYNPSEVKKLNIFDIVRKDQISHCKEIFRNIKKCKKFERVETVFISKEGKEINVEGNVNAYFKDGRFISTRAIFRDITERKKAEEELKDAHQILLAVNKQLERKVKERTAEIQKLLEHKDKFIGQLGHDLKTPLSILMNIIPLIHEEVKSQSAKKDLDIALRNVQYIKNLVKQTLKIAELSSADFSLDKKEINFTNLINEVLLDNKLVLHCKGIEFENKICTDLMVPVDDVKIKEVLYNLVNNAIKFTPDEGKISVDYKKDIDSITFIISDSGVGLTEEQLNHVFDEFYKADKSRHDLGGGGLGLNICKRIIEKHGGIIWAESAGEGKGSSFHFKLPLK